MATQQERTGTKVGDKTAFRVVGLNADFRDEIWLEPVTPPVISFRVTKGTAPTGIVLCRQTTEPRTEDTHKYSVLILSCENASQLEMTGVDFGGAHRH